MIKTFSDISEEIRELQVQLEAHAEENGGDITGFPLLDHLNGLEQAQKDKAGKDHMLCSLACMALEYEGEAEAMRLQAKRIVDQADKIEAKGEGIRNFISSQIQPGEKIKDSRVALSNRKSQAVDVTCEVTALPFEYQRVRVDADKALLKKALEGGAIVDGVTISTRYNLQIK